MGRVTQRQFGDHVIELYFHAQVLGDHAQLGADVAVADDAQGLAANFKTVGSGFLPAAAMADGVLLGDAPQQQDGFRQHQFRHRAGVGKGGVEYRNTANQGSVQVHLIGADAETADCNQLLGRCEDFLGQLGAGTDTDKVGVGNLLFQLIFRQGGLQVFDIGVPGLLEVIDG